MVLSSQTPRAGMSRRYMSSRRSRRVRWPWLVLAVAVIGGGIWMLWPNATDPAQAGPSASGGDSVVETGQVLTGGSAGPKGTARAEQPVPTLTFDTHGTTGVSQPVNPGPVSPPSPVTRDSTPVRVALTTDASAAAAIKRGMAMLSAGQLVQGRSALSRVLFSPNVQLSDDDASRIRAALTKVNQTLIFSSAIVADDPLEVSYTIQSGDYLSRLAPKFNLTHQFVEQINGIADPKRLQVGQKIKLLKGPFGVRVVKSALRVDAFIHAPDGSRIYVRSFPCGLGRDNSTPLGRWIIEPGHKMENPSYRNPRTGKTYGRNDPDNPVGEYWMALKGVDANTKGLDGYGIHGTIAPGSIGREESLGCVRLGKKDIAQLYRMLVGGSEVEIVQ